MSNPKDCIFCKIIKGEIQSKKIFENDKVLGIKDASPVAPVHYLFLPKAHLASLAEIKDFSIISEIFSALASVAKEEGIDNKGYRTVINTGQDGGQTVFHLHVHLIGGKPLSARMS